MNSNKTYAIVEIKKSQFKVFENKYVYIPFLSSKKKGDVIFFNKIILFCENKDVKIGKPILKNIEIKAEILDHIKGNKILIFKKNRRKGYKVKRGFRPILSKIKIISFIKN